MADLPWALEALEALELASVPTLSAPQVASRAMTEHGNTQPSREDAVSLYNLVGNICNYQTHTPVLIQPSAAKAA